MKAYVLINVRAAKSLAVARKVRQIKGVKNTDVCWGRPDIFSVVEVLNGKVLAQTVLSKIPCIDGVESTDTHIVVE